MEYILGVFVSIIVEAVKDKQNPLMTHVWLLVASIVIGGFYVWLSQTVWWSSILAVLTAAAAFHNLVIRKLDI